MADRVDEAAERLYGLALEDFVRERDAAARALRKDDRESAAAVGRLPKPAPQAWAANQVAREHHDLRDELLAAGQALRAAQEAALAGRGRDDLREATARERAAVDAFLDAAAGLRPAGRPLSAAARDRLRSTLRAAAADAELSAALAAGRLVADAEAGGAWPLGDAAPARAPAREPPRRRARRATGKRGDDGDGEREREAAEREAAAERERREAEAQRRRELRAQVDAARKERRARERERERAEREAERAHDAAREAAERAAAADAALDAARTAAERARDEAARLEEQSG